jgi:hypothetical protein
MNKQHILDEIKRTAAENGGNALGVDRFHRVTGVRERDWAAQYWSRWGEAVTEAGFIPNELNSAHDELYLLRRVAEFALEQGKFPVSRELELKRRRDSSFPSSKVIYTRFGRKAGLVQRLIGYCAANAEFAAVAEMCRPLVLAQSAAESDEAPDDFETGYVYLALMKVGREKRFKIGKTIHVKQRTRQVGVNLPEDLELVHEIRTDDTYGIAVDGQTGRT